MNNEYGMQRRDTEPAERPGLGKILFDLWENNAINRYSGAMRDKFVQAMQRQAIAAGHNTLGTAARFVAPIAQTAGHVLPVANAAMTGYAAGTMAYNGMPRRWQDTIGGTINQIAQNFGGGVDDSNYLHVQQPQYGIQRRPLPRYGQ